MAIDDSELFHYSPGYDPVKAREYYLRTRKLKGRRKGSRKTSTPVSRRPSRIADGPTNPTRVDPERNKRRQAELRAQKEALQRRLEKLREALAELVEAAKKRSGGDPNKSSPSKDKAPETQVDRADRNAAEKDRKPETAAQKRERAKAAKEAYEKENPNTLSKDVEILREQIADIRKKIQDALADAKRRQDAASKRSSNSNRRSTAGVIDTRAGSQLTRSGPTGR